MGLESLKFYLSKYNVILSAFVFMPNHWHGVLFRVGGFDLSGFMRDFKRFTSVQIRKNLEMKEEAKPFETGVTKYGRLTYTIWKNRFDVVSIFSPDVLKTKVDYIHFNPVRKALVKSPEEWKWSSARYYLLGEDVGIPIDWIG
jgi:putative transposase